MLTGLQKFTFKDLKDKFELLTHNPDFEVVITSYENRRNMLFSYTVVIPCLSVVNSGLGL